MLLSSLVATVLEVVALLLFAGAAAFAALTFGVAAALAAGGVTLLGASLLVTRRGA